MDIVKQSLVRAGRYSKKHWFVFLAILVYLFFSVYYVGLGSSITHCNNTINGLGDDTAGPVWREANTNNPPIGGYSQATNYPVGDNLSSPVDAVVVGQSVVLWTTAKIFGPVCGYNVTNMLGYISAALTMCGFIYSLTKGRRWLALLAGYAVAFTPFFQVKTGSHPGYGFQALLIGALWAFFSYVTTKRRRSAVALVVLMALCFYFDPYFSLLALTIIVPMVLVWLVIRYLQLRSATEQVRKSFRAQLKQMALFGGLFVLLVAPIGYLMVSQTSQINAATAGTRDDVIRVARVYSNMPSEYLLPFRDSFLFKLFGSYQDQVKSSWYAFSNGNISEDTVGIGLLMIVLVTLFFVVAGWEKLQKRRLGITKLLAYNPRLVIYGSLAFITLAVLLALPPVHFLGIPMPSYILLKITSTWRVLSREYVVVNIGIVILFIVSLLYFIRAVNMKKITSAVLYALCFLALFVQYQTYHPFKGLENSKFSYSNAPAGYYWLKNQSNITSIAEYPIEKATETNSHVYYLSMQLVYKKPMLNSALNVSPQDPLQAGIKNLADPQTVPTLHALGISAVVVHGVDPSEIAKIPYLSVDYVGSHGEDAGVPGSTAISKDIMVVARISNDTPKPTTSLQFLSNMVPDTVIQKSSVQWPYEVSSGTKMGLRRLPNEPGSTVVGRVCFRAKAENPGEIEDLNIERNGSPTITVPLTSDYQKVTFMADSSQTFSLTTSNKHSVQLTDLGCS